MGRDFDHRPSFRLSLALTRLTDLPLFARTQELLNLKTEMCWRRNNDEPDRFTYRGFLRCAECGSPLLSLSHSNGKSRHNYYVCRLARGSQTRWNAKEGKFEWRIKNNSCLCRRIRREHLEPMLDDVVSSQLSEPNFLLKLMRDHEQALNSGDSRTRIDRLTKEIATAEERKRRLKVLYINSDLDETEYEAAKSSIAAQIASAQRTLSELKPELPHVTKEALAELVTPFSDWNTLRQEDRRLLLASVVPVFKIAGYRNGRQGAAARTDIVIKGFYLKLMGEAPPRDGPGGGRKRRGKRVTHGSISDVMVVNDEDHRKLERRQKQKGDACRHRP